MQEERQATIFISLLLFLCNLVLWSKSLPQLIALYQVTRFNIRRRWEPSGYQPQALWVTSCLIQYLYTQQPCRLALNKYETLSSKIIFFQPFRKHQNIETQIKSASPKSASGTYTKAVGSSTVFSPHRWHLSCISYRSCTQCSSSHILSVQELLLLSVHGNAQHSQSHTC